MNKALFNQRRIEPLVDERILIPHPRTKQQSVKGRWDCVFYRLFFSFLRASLPFDSWFLFSFPSFYFFFLCYELRAVCSLDACCLLGGKHLRTCAAPSQPVSVCLEFVSFFLRGEKKHLFIIYFVTPAEKELRIAKFLNQYYVIKSIGGVCSVAFFNKNYHQIYSIKSVEK